MSPNNSAYLDRWCCRRIRSHYGFVHTRNIRRWASASQIKQTYIHTYFLVEQSPKVQTWRTSLFLEIIDFTWKFIFRDKKYILFPLAAPSLGCYWNYFLLENADYCDSIKYNYSVSENVQACYVVSAKQECRLFKLNLFWKGIACCIW